MSPLDEESARRRLQEQEEELAERDAELRSALLQLYGIRNSLGWRLLERFRRSVARLAPPSSRRIRIYHLFARAVELVLDEGWLTLFRRALRLRFRTARGLVRDQPPLDVQYQVWRERRRISDERRRALTEEVARFRHLPLISIVTPAYNTPETWLREAIESVRAQIYPHWQLCLADDGSTEPHVRRVLDEYQRLDPRINATILPHNQGIVAATNQALGLASGDFVSFLDHDDELAPDALLEIARRLDREPDLDIIYTDEDKKAADGRHITPFFKPDWSPDLLLSCNYFSHLSVYRHTLLAELGGLRTGLDGAQDYDLALRGTERTCRIGHVPLPLYTWRITPGSTAGSDRAKRYAFRAAALTLKESLARRGWQAEIEETAVPRWYRVRYPLPPDALVSIIIPTRDKAGLLRRCIRSIARRTSYPAYEIIVVDSAPEEPQPEFPSKPPLRFVPYGEPFSYAHAINLGAAHARGDYLLFLNDDTEVLSPGWLEAMLEHAQRPGVAAVGARLLYPDGRAQHEGVVLGLLGSASNVSFDYLNLGRCIRNCAAVTAACMMTRKTVFQELGGFDEGFRLAFNDIDYCLRARQRGDLIVYTPYAELVHYEGASRGGLHPEEDERLFRARWGEPQEQHDPYYNSNFDRQKPPFTLRI
jgi:GT2 family glycosyltransferase